MESWAGLKQERGGEKVLHFLEKKQTHSIKIRIQEIQIQIEPQTNKQCTAA